MSIEKSIGWCDVTWNPIRGCTNRCWATTEHPEGNCYAAAMARRKMTKCTRCHDHTNVHFHGERLGEPLGWRKPRRVFLGSMTDLWDPNVEADWRRQIWSVIAQTPQHEYIVLTKQPQNMIVQGIAMLRNLIVGVSVSSNADQWRIGTLRYGGGDPAWKHRKVRLVVSFEPVLGGMGRLDLSGIQWVIIGVASGQLRRVHGQNEQTLRSAITWILDEADSRECSVFIKPNAEPYVPEWLGKDELEGQYRRWPG